MAGYKPRGNLSTLRHSTTKPHKRLGIRLKMAFDTRFDTRRHSKLDFGPDQKNQGYHN